MRKLAAVLVIFIAFSSHADKGKAKSKDKRFDAVEVQASGALEGVAGLAFGRFTGPPADDVHAVADVLEEIAVRRGVPAVLDLPFGHTEHNCTLPVGVRARLDGSAGVLEILEPAVQRR